MEYFGFFGTTILGAIVIGIYWLLCYAVSIFSADSVGDIFTYLWAFILALGFVFWFVGLVAQFIYGLFIGGIAL